MWVGVGEGMRVWAGTCRRTLPLSPPSHRPPTPLVVTASPATPLHPTPPLAPPSLSPQVERERARLARDRETLEEERASQAETLRARWEEESRKLQRDRRVLEKQTKALLSLPGKKERQELEEMEMRLGGMKEEMQAREAKVGVWGGCMWWGGCMGWGMYGWG